MPMSKKTAKTAKIGVCRRHRTTEETDRDEILQVNVDPGSAIAHQIWPSSVKGGLYRGSQNAKNLPKIVVFGHRKPIQWTHTDGIWPVSVDLGSAVPHQIWPSSVKGGPYKSPQKCQNLPKIVFFWLPEADTMNTFRSNLACKCSIPNLALIGKSGWVQEPHKMLKFAEICFLATGSWHSEHIEIKFSV